MDLCLAQRSVVKVKLPSIGAVAGSLWVSVRATHLPRVGVSDALERWTNERQVVEVRRRRSRAEAEQLVAEYETSGLSRVEFCRKQGLSLATLARYRRRRSARRAGAREPMGGGGSVRRARGWSGGASSGLAVVLAGGRRIEVGRGFDAQTLAQLLGVLERY